MSETMIERVGDALSLVAKELLDEDWAEVTAAQFAAAAIEAMREPTDAMFKAGIPKGECPSYVDDIWKDMIEAALEAAE